MRNADIDIVKTNRWLKSSRQKVKTEGLIVATQDQSLQTRKKKKKEEKSDQIQYVERVNKNLNQLTF